MTIDEIFAALPEEPAQDAHEFLVIDPATRTIQVPESESIFGVEGDEDGERKYFISPRYVGDNVDLAACFLSIVYRNANGEKDQYLITDAAVNGEYVTFSWLISEKVVKYKGAVQFRFDADTAAGPAWGTTMANGESLEGLETEIDTVEEETSDVVTQLRAMVAQQTGNVEAVGAAQVQNVKTEGTTQVNTVKATGDATEAAALAAIEAKGDAVRASIPAEYTDLDAQVDKLTRDRAAAIVCQAEGELLQITDASNDPLQGLRIFGKTEQWKTTGKNLLQSVAQSGSVYGVTFYAYDDGRVHAVGTASQAAYLTLAGGYAAEKRPIPDWLVPGRQYVISDAGLFLYTEDGQQTSFTNMGFTMPEGYAYYGVFVRVSSGASVNKTYCPMLTAGPEALPWEPYSGGMAAPCPDWPQELQSVQAPALRVCGTNLCSLPDMEASEINGISWTYRAGAVIANGTATAMSNVAPGKCPLDLLPGTYTVSGGENGIYVIVTLQRGNLKEYYTSKNGLPVTFETISGDLLYLYTQAPNGTTAANVTVYPMVNAGPDALPWAPYKEHQALTITTPGGLPGIPVASGGNYTDANGQQWICDEVDLARGVYVQRCFVETLDFSYQADLNRYRASLSKPANTAYLFGNGIPLLCDKYCYAENAGGGTPQTHGIRIAATAPTNVIAYYNGEAIDSATVLYPLAIPIETPLTNVELQAFRALHSNKPTTTVLNDAGAHMVLEYAADPKTYIDNKLAALVAAGN